MSPSLVVWNAQRRTKYKSKRALIWIIIGKATEQHRSLTPERPNNQFPTELILLGENLTNKSEKENLG